MNFSQFPIKEIGITYAISTSTKLQFLLVRKNLKSLFSQSKGLLIKNQCHVHEINLDCRSFLKD